MMMARYMTQEHEHTLTVGWLFLTYVLTVVVSGQGTCSYPCILSLQVVKLQKLLLRYVVQVVKAVTGK